MLVITKGNKQYSYDGSLQEMLDNFSVYNDCLCSLDIKEYNECYFNQFFTGLEAIV